MALPEQNKSSPGTDKSKPGVSPIPEKDHDKGSKLPTPDQPGKPTQSEPHKQRTPQ